MPKLGTKTLVLLAMGVLSACGFAILLLGRGENSEHSPSLSQLATLAVASVVILAILAMAPLRTKLNSASGGYRPNLVGIGVLAAIGLIAGSHMTVLASAIGISKSAFSILLMVVLAAVAVAISRLSKGKGPG